MPLPRHPIRPTAASQAGIVMLVTLIALVIVLIGAVALMRSSDTASVIAGNLAFKRDLTNNAERAVSVALANFSSSGALYGTAAPYNSNTAVNYSATLLSTSTGNRGIPDVLLNDSLFASVGQASNDIVDATSGLTIRYVIDRMCSATGAVTPSTCTLDKQNSDKGGSSWVQKAGGGYLPVYRLSVRVSGPRNTQAFVQTTLAE